MQLTNLFLYGVCVATRNIKEHCILLFQLENFYVEIFVSNSSGEVTHCRCFQDTGELQPYLEQIDISGIV